MVLILHNGIIDIKGFYDVLELIPFNSILEIEIEVFVLIDFHVKVYEMVFLQNLF